MARNQLPLTWEQTKRGFEWDGSLRDITINNCNISDWKRIVSLLEKFEHYSVHPNIGNNNIIDKLDYIFSGDLFYYITAKCNNINLKCDIVSPDVVEFDLDPREIRSEQDFHDLIKFMRSLALATNKSVILTEEGMPSEVIIEIEPR
jgi:hypothetical protein